MSDGRLLLRCAVFIMLADKDNKVLLQRRQNTGFLDGYYDFVSGHLEHGESIQEAAVRETLEEVCVRIKPDDLELVHINQNMLDTPYFNFTFICRSWEGEIRIGEPDKCSDFGFYAMDALPEKSTLNVRVIEKMFNPSKLTTSYVDRAVYQQIMNEEFS